MATINLRPWREERRERLKKEFLQVTLLICAFAGLAWFGWNRVVTGWIEYQQSRNSVLQKEISVLDDKVKEIDELKQKKDDLIARMKVIQDLQGTRPMIVYIFDELAKTIPDGVFYTKVIRQGNKITLAGTSESNQRVSTLMRSLDESEWFANPNLTKIVANKKISENGNDFDIALDISKKETIAESGSE